MNGKTVFERLFSICTKSPGFVQNSFFGGRIKKTYPNDKNDLRETVIICRISKSLLVRIINESSILYNDVRILGI